VVTTYGTLRFKNVSNGHVSAPVHPRTVDVIVRHVRVVGDGAGLS
jgi:hypothetical protein